MNRRQYHTSVQKGTLDSINADGSGEITVLGRPSPYSLIDISKLQSPIVGQDVFLGFYDKNRNIPFVITMPVVGNSSATAPTSSLNWHNWRAALYRGGWNNTNILPNLSLPETTLYTHPNPEGTAPTFGCSKIHDGYVYGTEYYASYDNRLIRISLADGTKTYATWTGDTLNSTPKDLMLTEEDDVLYAYFAFQGGYGGYGLYWGKYNLTTMARVYYTGETFFNTSRTVHWRMFCDDTYFYLVYYDGAWERYEFIRKHNRITGAYVSTSTISWPVFDYQADNYTNFYADIRASIEPKAGGGLLFPTLANQSTSGIIYEVPAIRFSDGGVEWKYAPESIEITKQFQAYCLYWYCYDYFGGGSFDLTYSTTNLFYYFTDRDTDDKQIRSTLIACNDTLAVVLSEETTIKNNADLKTGDNGARVVEDGVTGVTDASWRAYDDWQQTVWVAQDWPDYSGFVRRYVEGGQGAPGMDHADFAAMRNQVTGAYASVALDSTPLPFSWIEKKEINLVILDIATGEVLRTITGESYLEDTGETEDDLVIPADQLIESVRACSHYIEITRDKWTMTPYAGPGFDEFMGIEADEEVRNGMRIMKLDFWVPEWDTETYDFDYYWNGMMKFAGYPLAIYDDTVAMEMDNYGVTIQNVADWDAVPYNLRQMGLRMCRSEASC